jgi:antitoxin component of RelBE/YafQ-DinJ toxin-antitoxin module
LKTAVVRARIPETLKKEFEKAAASHGWNLSQAIRQLMNQYVAQEKEIIRRNQETLEALEDIEAGRIVEGEIVLNWLSGWGTDDEQEPPS